MISEAVRQTLGLDEATARRAETLHAESIVIDCGAVVKQEDAHFERFRAGGVTAVDHTVTQPDIGLAEALAAVNECRRWIEAHSEQVILGLNPEDITRAKESGREAIIFGPQDTLFLERDLNNLGAFYDLGLRILQLTYQTRNWVGDGCGEPEGAGLTRFGRDLVREMNRLGMVIDLSHCGRRTAMEAIELSSDPVVFSHAHPYSLRPHVRAKDDELLLELAKRGGVIGPTALSAFVAKPEEKRPGLREFVAHVDYLLQLLGTDHVGIGLDFDETNTVAKHEQLMRNHPELELGEQRPWDDRKVEDLTSAADVGGVTAALVATGHDDDTIRKVVGGNFLRVFREVWG